METDAFIISTFLGQDREWLLLNAKAVIFQLYHGENELYLMRW